MKEPIVQNCMVEKKLTWINPEYKKPAAREELYLVIFSGHRKNVTYQNAIATAFYDEDDGWYIESVNDNASLMDLKVHYYANVNIPDEMKVEEE